MKKVIPDCYWPSSANGAYASHEAICVLNQGDEPAELDITLYFEDREPVSGYHVTVGARRTKHIRMDKLTNHAGQPVPQDTPYAAVVECIREVALQYSRVDTTQAELGMMTTLL